jgi:hypothetical protein
MFGMNQARYFDVGWKELSPVELYNFLEINVIRPAGSGRGSLDR